MELYFMCPQCLLPAGECRCGDAPRKKTATTRLYRGDITHCYKTPVPVEKDGKRVGTLTSVRFDGEYTVGVVEYDAEAL